MNPEACTGCAEYAELSRRGFLHAAAGAGAAAAVLPAWLPRVALAESHRSSMRDVLVCVFLRGAADGLTMCVPYGDSGYYAARPTIAVARPDQTTISSRCIDLDGFFGLPPAMAPLLPAYADQKLLIVHACGIINSDTRSHFDAQRFIESGTGGEIATPTGWLGRHLSVTGPSRPGSLLRGVGISMGLQRALYGGPSTIAVPDLANFGLAGAQSTAAARQEALRVMHDQVADPLRSTSDITLATIDLLRQINFSTYQPAGGATYQNVAFATALKSTAALIKADIGVEAVAIDYTGWDTHANHGTAAGGWLYNLLYTLSYNLAAFYRDMTAATAPNFVVLVMSEFGRRVAQNGSGGTDHGHGGAMLAMGNAILGGRVVRDWPGLHTDQLFEGLDLQVTIDYRDILAEIVQFRLGNYELGTVFPGYDATFRGVTN